MDELYKEYDQSEAITDEALERIKSAGMQDEYEAIKRHLWSSVTLINNLQLDVIRKDNRLNELVNEDNTREEILRIIQNDILFEKEKTHLENLRKGGSKTMFPEFKGAAIKIIEGWKNPTLKDATIIAERAEKNLDENLIPNDSGKVVRNLIKKL